MCSVGICIVDILMYRVVIYPTALNASCDIGLAYPTAVYARSIIASVPNSYVYKITASVPKF